MKTVMFSPATAPPLTQQPWKSHFWGNTGLATQFPHRVCDEDSIGAGQPGLFQ